MPNTKQRGRPRNASRLNESDYANLKRVADCLVASPGLRYPTTAMRQIGIDHPNDHKRLLSKWWPVADRYMAEAQQRRIAAQVAAFEHGMQRLGAFAFQVAEGLDRFVSHAVNRYERWANENPREAATLKTALVGIRTVQINAKSART